MSRPDRVDFYESILSGLAEQIAELLTGRTPAELCGGEQIRLAVLKDRHERITLEQARFSGVIH